MDQDLAAKWEAREAARAAEKASRALAQYSQERLDAIVEAMAAAFEKEAAALAEQAVQETGFGNARDKLRKNLFACRKVSQAVRDMRCVGLLREEKELWEYGVPVGVIAAIVPSTNPTSTVCYKAIVALKAGNAIVFSPHPKAMGCTRKAVQILAAAAEQAGAPKGSIGCLSIPALAGCQELMVCPEVKLILATGGPGMVKAAYSSGKPAIGVGAGNGPAYIHHSADAEQAMGCILESKTFDNGTVCASEQSIICEARTEEALLAAGKKLGFCFLEEDQARKLGQILFRPDGRLDPKVVGRTAGELARLAGFSVPADAKVLVAREEEAGPSRPYSMEKLCPVLALYVMESEDAVLNMCIRILEHEGSGHTFAIHAKDPAVVKKFAARIPVSRLLVNTPAALGGIGESTGLFPALTLGCGAVGGSSSSNNISPLDLIDIRRVAWGAETVSPSRPEAPRVDAALVEELTRKILQRLE